MDSANFDAIMAELFPSANDVQSSGVTNMPLDSVNPVDSANFDAIMAELFPSANDVQSSDVTDMPLDAAFYSSDIPFIPADQPIATLFQYSPPN